MGVSGVERNRWLRAVWLHDALKDAPEEEKLREQFRKFRREQVMELDGALRSAMKRAGSGLPLLVCHDVGHPDTHRREQVLVGEGQAPGDGVTFVERRGRVRP